MSMAIAERVELDALTRQVDDLSQRIDGIEAGRVLQPGLGAPRELLSLLRVLAEHVQLLERRLPGREPFPAGDVMRSLEALERQCAGLAAVFPSEAGNEQRQGSDALADLAARIEALERHRDPESLRRLNAPRVAHGEALRAAIAVILQSEPRATGPLVLERLRSTHAGRLPSLRTLRWHLAALRGNGNSSALPNGAP